MGDYGEMPVFSHNVFWENDLNVYQIYFRTPGGVVRTIEDVQALGGDYTTNRHSDPLLSPELIGQIDSVRYDTITDHTYLFVTETSLADRKLKPGAIMPDT